MGYEGVIHIENKGGGGGLKNPFEFFQLKTDYTPTGSEEIGTYYWDADRIRTVTAGGVKDLAFTTDMPDFSEYYYYETDSASVTYYYFGYKQVGLDKWRIRRVHKTTYAVGWAIGDTDYNTNRTNRISLTYNSTL